MGVKSKVDLYGLAERVIRLYNTDGRTLKEIEGLLREEGFDISREAIRRSVKSAGQAAAEYKAAYEESRAIVDAVRENPNTDTYEAITSLIASKLLNQIKDIEAFDFEDPIKMMDGVAKMTRAQVQVSKFRMEYQKGFNAAKKEFLESLNAELEGHPELKSALVEVVSHMEAPEK